MKIPVFWHIGTKLEYLSVKIWSFQMSGWLWDFLVKFRKYCLKMKDSDSTLSTSFLSNLDPAHYMLMILKAVFVAKFPPEIQIYI